MNEIKRIKAMAALPHFIVKFPHDEVRALIDTGASSNFVDQILIRKLNLEINKLKTRCMVKGAFSEDIYVTDYCKLTFCINNNRYQATALIIPLKLTCNLILRMPFINEYKHIVDEVVNQQTESVNGNIEIVSRRNIKKSINKKGQEVFLCWISGTKDTDTRVPTFIEEEFKDIVVEKLPHYNITTNTINHEIHIVPGSSPVFKRPYRMSESERQELDRQLKELIKEHRVEPCDSPFAARVIFVKKKDGTKRLCVDCILCLIVRVW